MYLHCTKTTRIMDHIVNDTKCSQLTVCWPKEKERRKGKEGWDALCLVSSWTSLPILLWYQQGIFVHATATLDIFFFFILCRDGCVWKSQYNSFWNTQTSLSGSNNHATFKGFWCSVWTSASHLKPVYMPECNELLPSDWLIMLVFIQMFPTWLKLPVVRF